MAPPPLPPCRLVVLLLSMYRFQTWALKSSDSKASLPAGDADSSLEGGTRGSSMVAAESEAAMVVDGGGAAAPSQRGLMRRMQFWKRG